uniref:Radical S-adenosyl methionine domain containing 1 n=1 Tax=Pipistrellus kuhlii TaxID=59472 RepID=A0A7J7U8R8_PIPKU|nr:radical S-adenosyl methionine domain containing 1 [Pipistrellus kuhlii]
MALPRARAGAGAWAAAAKAAQRRRRAEGAGGSPSPAARSQRAALYVHSLDDAELQLLGRTHSANDALRTLAEARGLFPGRVSVDLMLGLPAQQVGPWLRRLGDLLRRCDDHVSLYQLSLERGTALFARVQRGALPAPDPELAAEMYQEGRAALREAGFRQYEVSNFARNGPTGDSCPRGLAALPGRLGSRPLSLTTG